MKVTLQPEVALDTPFSINHHEEYPKVDCSHVVDAAGNELCTVFIEGSAIVARVIADALNEKYPLAATPSQSASSTERNPERKAP